MSKKLRTYESVHSGLVISLRAHKRPDNELYTKKQFDPIMRPEYVPKSKSVPKIEEIYPKLGKYIEVCKKLKKSD